MATTEDRIPAGAPERGIEGDGLEIRPAAEGDLGAIAGIESGSFSNPWHPHTFRSLLQQDRACLFVAADSSQQVLGYAIFWWVLDQAELANLAVRKEHRGLGLGAALLDRVLDEARTRRVESVFLEVRASNESARRLYLSRSFTQISVRRNYYRSPREDALVLVRLLGPAPGRVDGVGKGRG